MGRQAKIKASLAWVPITALPNSIVGTNHPINAAMIAEEKHKRIFSTSACLQPALVFLHLPSFTSLFLKDEPK